MTTENEEMMYQRQQADQARSDNQIINESSVISASDKTKQDQDDSKTNKKDDSEDQEMSEPPQKEVFIKVNSIEIEDKTLKVINKLRKMSNLFDQVNRLKFA